MRAVVSLCVTGLVVPGCVLFTGSTDGYSLLDSGSSASASCSSVASCGAVGICCLASNPSGPSVSGVCLPSCSIALPQLCTTSAECGDAVPCLLQRCTFDGGTDIGVSVHLCGTSTGCVAIP
jgi:hypothetical protein